MPKFSDQSLKELATCHLDLQILFNEIIKYFDCTIIQGRRGEIEQNEAFKNGKSKLQYPDGKHNDIPSLAADVASYPIYWSNTAQFYFFSGYVLGIAKLLKSQGKMQHDVRYGGNWDCDNQVNHQSFNDLVHFELIL